MEYKAVLIKKIDKKHSCWKILLESNRITGLSVSEVIDKYNGFTGDFLFCFSENYTSEKLIDFIITCKEVIKNESSSEYCLLFMGSPNSKIPEFIKNSAMFLGYEYGFLKNETSHYSSIFNEIIFGDFEELISFKDKLNSSLLFSDYEIAIDYAKVHHHLFEEGRGVEGDEDMKIYEIWKFPLEKEE